MTLIIQSEENKKALLYTFIICGTILLLFIFIRWHNAPPATPIIQDQIEINLGNDFEGFGDEQPLIKGSATVEKNIPSPTPETKSTEDQITPDDNDNVNAAPIVKNDKPKEKAKEKNIVQNKTKEKPKLIFEGTNKGKNGNNPNEDNGFKSQGNNANNNGDNGNPNGNKDSYGNSPGGNTGGPKVIRGNRKIVRQYKFEGELNKATIFAIIKVSPNGEGKFAGFEKNSTSRSKVYADAINNYLNKIQFNKSSEESTVTVQFIFDIN